MSDAGTDDSEVLTVDFEFVPDNGQPAPPAPWRPTVIEFRNGNRWCGYTKPADTTPRRKLL